MDTAIQQLIDMLKTASPVVWATLVKQAQIDAYLKIAWALVALVVCFVAYQVAVVALKKSKDGDYSNDWGSMAAVLGIVSLASLVVAVGLLISAATRLANPEFYAIQYLLDSIK